MNRLFTITLICFTSQFLLSQKTTDFTTVFEKSGGMETATYQETISYYERLANTYPEINIQAIGKTDSGKSLHLVTLNADSEFDFDKIRRSNKRILLINNGIHPGESDGIDATMILYRDIVQGKISMPENTVLATIPIYNVGGSLNRNTGTRANQNGPVEYGFRGNARNYDLNRDFIKCDTDNAKTFAQIFHFVKPDVFIDNHVSNGADYQYTLTHLFTQHNKLGGSLGEYLNTVLMPALELKLAEKDWDITPYVNVFNQIPEIGFSQFMDYPRYSTGYTTLWNTLGMMVETHMLKPYKQRVEGTYELMISMIEIIEDNHEAIKAERDNAFTQLKIGSQYSLDWKIDSTNSTILNFKGYEGEFIKSEITGAKRLKYNRKKPFTKEIVYQNYFKPSIEVTIPKAYVVPQGWHNVIELLKLNNVEMKRFSRDTTITIESYRISKYETRKNAYEGHYPHYNTEVELTEKKVTYRTGDYLISTNQPAMRYLLETLEPNAPDSFFNWNFFDTILQQKEGFSPYVFEDEVLEILNSNPDLKKEFEAKKLSDSNFENNWYLQLNWIFEHTNHYEKAHMQYPITRMR
jgi:hypothetical protein